MYAKTRVDAVMLADAEFYIRAAFLTAITTRSQDLKTKTHPPSECQNVHVNMAPSKVFSQGQTATVSDSSRS